MDSSLGLNIFTLLFLTGTFLAALVAGLGGFAFGIVAAAVSLYILSPLQTAILIMGLGLVVQGYSVWKLRHSLHWRRLTPILVATARRIAWRLSSLLATVKLTKDDQYIVAPVFPLMCSRPAVTLLGVVTRQSGIPASRIPVTSRS